MPSNDSGGPSATDIITYVGVPLAVAGVLPIAYTATTTLIFRNRLLKKLEESQAATIRSTEILNRVIEVQFPRYRLAIPYPTGNPSGAGIQPADTYPRSGLPGGTWTFLAWHRQDIGSKIQRLTPGDEPCQPQAEIGFLDLVKCLYRLGAEADPSGWNDLRIHGTWVRRGLVLMRIGSSAALVIAKSDDSDGFLALKLHIDVDWPTLHQHRGATPPKTETILLHPTTIEGHTSRVGTNDEHENNGHAKASTSTELPLPAREENQEASTAQDSPHPGRIQERPILCQFSTEGLIRAEWHPSSNKGDVANTPLDIPIHHLRSGEDVANQAMWFASCAIAFQTTKNPPIVSFRIPDYILHVAQFSGIPPKVLDVLYDRWGGLNVLRKWKLAGGLMLMKGCREYTTSISTFSKIRLLRLPEIPKQSMSCPIQEVAERGLNWLKSLEKGLADLSVEDVGATVLYRMVVDQQFAKEICSQLDNWKAYIDNAERTPFMNMDSVEGAEIFAEATLLLALIAQVTSGTLPNMQSCIDTFKYVKLG